jgi:hypothetical protein
MVAVSWNVATSLSTMNVTDTRKTVVQFDDTEDHRPLMLLFMIKYNSLGT